jgi:hypothetical protein
LHAYKEYDIPAKNEAEVYVLAPMSKLLGLNLVQNGEDVLVKYQEYEND